jgi:2-deoxy-D-gluconate 3-dehydrogenase
MTSIMDQFKLDRRVAVLTGGAGLLGREFSRTLAEAGAQVVIADRDRPASEALADELNRRGLTALGVETDVTRPDSVNRMVKAALTAFGRVDILVNSAALDPKFDPDHIQDRVGSFEDFPLEAWEQSLSVDLTGAFLCAQAVASPMLENDGGVIVNLCSIYGLVGPDQRIYQTPGGPVTFKPVTYSVTKAGVLGLTRYLATYYASKNIRVNALSPGGVYNDHDPGFIEAYSSRAVLGRMARKDELNGALLFLASDASAYMTGANLVVDGGWTAW